MLRTKSKNPSSIDFGIRKRSYASPEALQKAKKDNSILRKWKNIWIAKKFPDKFPTDLGVCWMCWIDLTGEMLQEWRTLPFSEVEFHDATCPLCGYSSWKGRIWYPFRFIRGYIGNPSSRKEFKRGKML